MVLGVGLTGVFVLTGRRWRRRLERLFSSTPAIELASLEVGVTADGMEAPVEVAVGVAGVEAAVSTSMGVTWLPLMTPAVVAFGGATIRLALSSVSFAYYTTFVCVDYPFNKFETKINKGLL